MVLSASYLGAFRPHPVSGSLYGPSLEIRPGASLLITDGRHAEDLQMSTLLVMEELDSFRTHLLGRREYFPKPLPPTEEERESSWTIASVIPGERPLQARAQFLSNPSRQVLWDLRDANNSFYTAGFSSQAGEVSQTIQIDARYDTVTTDNYFLQVRSMSFARAVELALMFSAALYNSDQYDVDRELGPLSMQSGDDPKEELVSREGDRFRLEKPLIDDHKDLSFRSTASLVASDDFREPVYEAYISIPNSNGLRDVSLTLYRPPERPELLMPLSLRLLLGPWNLILQRIQPSNSP